jgi:hypothetical protein
MAVWNIVRTLGIFYDHLARFMFIWYIFSRFGIMCQEKSGNPAFGAAPVPVSSWPALERALLAPSFQTQAFFVAAFTHPIFGARSMLALALVTATCNLQPILSD